MLGAAARTASVAAVALYEPGVVGVGGEEDFARLVAAVQQVGALASEGRLRDAARAFLSGICTDDEVAALDGTAFCERWAGGIPALLRFVQQDASYEGPRSTDPDVLGRVAAPVLLLRGERTLLGDFFAASARHLGQHIADAARRKPAVPANRRGSGLFAPERQSVRSAD